MPVASDGALQYQRMEELFFTEGKDDRTRDKDENEDCSGQGTMGAASTKVEKWYLQRVHQSPNIYTIDNFLSETELEHLTDIIRKHSFHRSFVDNQHASDTMQYDAHRTSSFVGLTKNHDARIAGIERKVATLLGCSPSTVEPLQLVRYLPGQFFGVHHDMGDYDEETSVVSLPPKNCLARRRLVTIFCYLNDVEFGQGGCTLFPACATTDGSPLRVQPQRGRAVLFSNVTRKGTPDPRTIHAGEPVIDHSVMVAKEQGGADDSASLKKNKKKASRKQVTPTVVKYGLNCWLTE